MNTNTTDAKDTVSAKCAECYATIEGRRYNLFNYINFEATLKKTKSKVARLGAIMAGHKTTGAEGTYKGKKHYISSDMRKLAEKYKDSGVDIYYDIHVVNEDPTSSTGRQEVIFYNCNEDSAVLAKFDADGDTLDEDVEGTFEDFSIATEFNTLTGYEL